MARGWESKSVEAQREEGLEDNAPWKPAEELEAELKLKGLERSRTRIERELSEASTDAHRVALKNALDHLDHEIEVARKPRS